MISTVDQDREFRLLFAAIQESYTRMVVDGNGYPALDAEKQKTKDLVDAADKMAKLAHAIAANGESDRKPLMPADFGKKANGGMHPVTAAMIERDAKKADQIRLQAGTSVEAAKARADATLFKRRG
jgi:hypothetical protein